MATSWGNISGAWLGGANLQGAVLVNADLRGTQLGSTNLQGAVVNNTRWPDGFDPQAARVVVWGQDVAGPGG
jgi:uncharacterized protein YjbI with pentapeptide repeats